MKRLIFTLSALFCGLAFSAQTELFGPATLAQENGIWAPHHAVFIPAKEKVPAKINYIKGWSALIGRYQMPQKMEGTLSFTLNCRMTGKGDTGIFMMFYDSKMKRLKLPAGSKHAFFLKKNTQWQKASLNCKIPADATMVRFDITGSGDSPVELSEARLVYDGNTSLDMEKIRLAVSDGELLFGKESLFANGKIWGPHQANYIPASNGKLAEIHYPVGKWAALIGTFPIDTKLQGEIIFRIKCRWKTLPKQESGLGLMFNDADKTKLKLPKSATDFALIRKTTGRQTIQVKSPIPKGAVNVRVDVTGGSGGILEVEDVQLRFKGSPFTKAAVDGIVLPKFCPASRKAGKPEKDHAEIECFDSVPFDFNTAFWNARPEYRIPNTDKNKSPLSGNDQKAFFRLAADDSNLYVYFRALDDVLNFNDETIYCRDAFELFLMPTGRFGTKTGGLSIEQYTVSRDPAGKTVTMKCQAKTRLIPGGWEALMKVPLKNETRRIYPFNGLELTFNVCYQDADTKGQEHWLSYSSKDQAGMSWNNPSLYVPLTFVSQRRLPYQPLWLGDKAEYNVAAKFSGRINLVEAPALLKNIGFWDPPPIAKLSADGKEYRIEYPPYQTAAFRPQMLFFSVLPGEVIEYEYEGKVSSGTVSVPTGGFLAQTNWAGFGFKRTSKSPVLNTEWQRVTFRGTVPDMFRTNKRSGRLLMNWGDHPGKTLYLRNFKVTRRLPVDFDAAFKLKGRYAHFPVGKKSQVDILFDTPSARKVKVNLQAKSYFDQKIVLSRNMTMDLKEGRSVCEFDFSELPAGFFNLLLKVRDVKGAFLADRELYVAKYYPAEKMNPAAGIWFGTLSQAIPPVDYTASAAEYKSIGTGCVYEGDIYFFNKVGQPYAHDPLAGLKAYRKQGFSTASLLPRGTTFFKNKIPQPMDVPTFFEQCLKRSAGAVDYLNFANEANLDGGWAPSADAREWAQYYRIFSNAVHRYAPGTKVVIGNMNGIPIEYLKKYHEQNGLAFGEGIIGVHLYNSEHNGNIFSTILTARKKYDELFPGWKVWDMESGTVYHTFNLVTEMLTKKMPIHLTAGIERSYFYHDADVMAPGADATPLSAVAAWKNRFYLNAKPVGRITLAENSVHAYLFKRPDGTGAVVLWNVTTEAVSLNLPGSEKSVVRDQFGNEIKNKGPLLLNDRFVRYIENADLSKLIKHSSFIAAFHPQRKTPLLTDTQKNTESVTVFPENVTRNFDLSLAKNIPVKIRVIYRNDSEQNISVMPEIAADQNLAFSFRKEAISLKPGEMKALEISIVSKSHFKKCSFRIGGRLNNSKQLIPLTFTAEPAPEIKVEGFTRSITVSNYSDAVTDIELVPESPFLFFRPASLTVKAVKPGETRTITFDVEENKTNNQRPLRLNIVSLYDIHVRWAKGEFNAKGHFIAFKPGRQTGKIDFSKPQNSTVTQDGLKVYYWLYESNGKLIFAARIFDTTPIQTREGGHISMGGDVCQIFLNDGKKYLEYGFSAAGKKPCAYLWHGNFGLETAVDAMKYVKRLEFVKDSVYIAAELPLEGMKPVCGLSIRFTDKLPSGKERRLELGNGFAPKETGRMGIWLTK